MSRRAATCSSPTATRAASVCARPPTISSAATSATLAPPCALTSPTVNCYKRLQVGQGLTGTRSGFTWTSTFITYGDNNRTQMIRTPEPGHVEDRTVSSAFNPHRALAAYRAASLDGIRRRLDPDDPNRDNTYALDLEEMARRQRYVCCRRACTRPSRSWSATR